MRWSSFLPALNHDHSISTPLLKLGVERLIYMGVLRGSSDWIPTRDSAQPAGATPIKTEVGVACWVGIANADAVVLLGPHLTLVGVSIGKERGGDS